MIYFTSDTHFYHDNIRGYCNRPFDNVEIMNEAMIERWNKIVTPEDTIYHLGDFCMGRKEVNCPLVLPRLNGHKILIKGNHDRSIQQMISYGFNEAYDNMFLQTEKGLAYLAHEPKPNGHWAETAEFQLCGHVHDHWKVKEKWYNVGVDVWDFYPKTIHEIIA